MNNQFEKEYYENPELWDRGRYLEADIVRTQLAASWIPATVNKVLDAGCGNGIFLDQLGDGFQLVGFDRSFAAVRTVLHLAVQADIADMPFPDGSVDMIVCMEVLEHLPQGVFGSALRELARVARGHILISVPYRENLRARFTNCPNCNAEFHRALHMRSFDRVDLVRLFENVNAFIRPVRIQGVFEKPYPFAPKLYRWLKKRGRRIKFQANAVCPNCGCRPRGAERREANASGRLRSFVARTWPLVYRYRWWMALYSKGQ